MLDQDPTFEEACMDRALSIAERGRGNVEPNPMVGCVIAIDQRIIGEGYHQSFGGPHAEVEALRSCSFEDLEHATLYVTLEPCCHQGKTPPCVDAILESGIRRVVIAMRDPFPKVDGGGISRLREAGIDVSVGLREQQAKQLTAPFCKLVQHARPWVIAKWAMTLDGKIASKTRSSKWISGKESREIVHRIRSQVDAILVGVGTVKADDPLLTARSDNTLTNRRLLRVVVDSRADIDLESRIVQTAGEFNTLVAVDETADPDRCKILRDSGCQVVRFHGDRNQQLSGLLSELGKRQITNLLVEGGADVFGSFLDIEEIDEFHVFVAPKLMGGKEAISPVAGLGCDDPNSAVSITIIDHNTVGDDIHIHGYIRRTEK